MTEFNDSNEPIVVHKYGGSSVADSEGMRRVAKRIVTARESGKRVVVVVSAMAQATDDLLLRAREVASAPSRRELDMLLSCGERASMALLAMAVHELGHEAVSLTGSQSGIMTNSRHSGARIIEVRPIRVMDELDNGKIVIVAGFQGVSYKREITTLGRGGSDTTAVALAAALGAESCEICSDVDGIYSADPRIVDDAKFIEALASDKMLELAAHGAKVLHASCVEIARRSDIRLYACATAKDDRGTRIAPIPPPDEAEIVGIAGQKGLVRLRATCRRDLLSAMATTEVEVLHFSSQPSSSELWFSLANVPDWTALRGKLVQGPMDQELGISEGLGAVSIVGEGLGSDLARIAALLDTAQRAAVEVLGISSSPLRITLYCEEDKVDLLVQELHRTFV